MLILSEAQVETCRVAKHVAGEVKQYPGVKYQDKLFRRLKQLPGLDNAPAVTLARRFYNETAGQPLVLVVEEEIIHSVWCEDKALARLEDLPSEPDPIQQIDLEAIVSRLRNVGGISIKDRRYGLKSYPRCFVGQEAHAWLMSNLELTSDQTIRLGQRLVDERWIYHVTQDHGFEDAELFYRFYWDDK